MDALFIVCSYFIVFYLLLILLKGINVRVFDGSPIQKRRGGGGGSSVAYKQTAIFLLISFIFLTGRDRDERERGGGGGEEEEDMVKMERKSVVICILVGLLGLLSSVLGFAAEAKRIKVPHKSYYLSLSLAEIEHAHLFVSFRCKYVQLVNSTVPQVYI